MQDVRCWRFPIVDERMIVGVISRGDFPVPSSTGLTGDQPLEAHWLMST